MKSRTLPLPVVALVLAFAAPIASAQTSNVHIVFLLHEKEYDTERTVPEFADEELAKRFGFKCTYLTSDTQHALPGTSALDDAHLMFVSVHRQVLPEHQFEPIRRFCAAGKPVVGIRTASHAFNVRGGRPRLDGVQWPEFDADLFGGNYHGHTDNKDGIPPTLVWTVRSARAHTILSGVEPGPWGTASWLYLTAPLQPSARVLMMGSVGNEADAQPVAWTNIGRWDNRTFYTSLGHPDDFEDPRFRRLLLNGILWALGEQLEFTEGPDAAAPSP